MLVYEKLTGEICGAAIEVPVTCKGVRLDCGYRLDLVVMEKVVLELKAVEEITGLHQVPFATVCRTFRQADRFADRRGRDAERTPRPAGRRSPRTAQSRACRRIESMYSSTP